MSDRLLIKISILVFITFIFLVGGFFLIKSAMYKQEYIEAPVVKSRPVFPDSEKKEETASSTKDVPVYNTSQLPQTPKILPIQSSWNKFFDEELQISFSYPKNASLSDCFTDDNCPPEVFNIISTQVPLNSVYDLWAYKAFEIFIRKGQCSVSFDKTISKNGLLWGYTETLIERETATKKQKEKSKIYSHQEGGVCFELVERIYGPKIGGGTSAPKNLEAFFTDEFIILDQILDTFVLEI